MTDLKALALRDVPEDDTITSFYNQDCPICMIPLPFDADQAEYKICCGKRICLGCSIKCTKTNHEQQRPIHMECCPFCRSKIPESDQSAFDATLRRAEEYNDAVAAFQISLFYHFGRQGVKKSKEMALKWCERSAKLGCPRAFHNLAAYCSMEDDEEKCKMYLSQAAKSGFLDSRYQLSLICSGDGFRELAAGHALVAACAGHDKSLDLVKEFYTEGIVSKNDFATALRSHQAAHDERKSKDRDMALDFKGWVFGKKS